MLGERRQPRAGLIGPGGIGAVHADALRRLGVEIGGVAASSPASAERYAESLGAGAAFGSAEALIASEAIDVVHVCTPNAQHYGQCKAALAAGKHVVAEKPLATAVAAGEELLALAAASGRVHALCHNYRYYPMVGALRALVREGRLGRVHTVHGSYLLEELLTADVEHWMFDPERMGPALSLADVGVHWWDLVEHVTDESIEEVLCERRSIRRGEPEGAEDSAAVLLRLTGSAIAAGTICQAAPGHGNTVTLEVIGDRGAAAWDIRDADRLQLREVGGLHRVLQRGSAELGGGTLPLGQPEGQADAFRDLLADVYAAIRGERREGLSYPTFADGVHGLRVLAALLESARAGNWTRVAA